MSGNPGKRQDLFGPYPITPFVFLLQLGRLIEAAKRFPTEGTETEQRTFMRAYHFNQGDQGRQDEQNNPSLPESTMSKLQAASDMRHTTVGTSKDPSSPAGFMDDIESATQETSDTTTDPPTLWIVPIQRLRANSPPFEESSPDQGKKPNTQTKIKSYLCTICERQFPRQWSLDRHLRVHDKDDHAHVNTDDRNLEGKECNRQITHRRSLTHHMDQHNEDRPYPCTVCGQRFKRTDQLRIHAWIHTGVKPYTCDVCEQQYTQYSSLYRHKKTHTGIKPFLCTQCGLQFMRKERLKTHILIHTGEKPYKCRICGEKYRHRNTLAYHLEGHTGRRRYNCKICNKEYRHASSLAYHLDIHMGTNKHMCNICNKEFNGKQNWKRHIKTHTQVRSLKDPKTNCNQWELTPTINQLDYRTTDSHNPQREVTPNDHSNSEAKDQYNKYNESSVKQADSRISKQPEGDQTTGDVRVDLIEKYVVREPRNRKSSKPNQNHLSVNSENQAMPSTFRKEPNSNTQTENIPSVKSVYLPIRDSYDTLGDGRYPTNPMNKNQTSDDPNPRNKWVASKSRPVKGDEILEEKGVITPLRNPKYDPYIGYHTETPEKEPYVTSTTPNTSLADKYVTDETLICLRPSCPYH